MPKTIWDLKFGDLITTQKFGISIFHGFLGEGLECEIFSLDGKRITPTSEIRIYK
jgi:hypothetical protein